MSAYIVADAVINAVVTCLATMPGHEGDWLRDQIARETALDLTMQRDCAALAAKMFQTNVEGVEARYGKGSAADFRPLDFRYAPVRGVTALQAYKALKCWMYQCCEGDVPEASETYRAMLKIRGELADSIVTNLPAYNRESWG